MNIFINIREDQTRSFLPKNVNNPPKNNPSRRGKFKLSDYNPKSKKPSKTGKKRK